MKLDNLLSDDNAKQILHIVISLVAMHALISRNSPDEHAKSIPQEVANRADDYAVGMMRALARRFGE